MKKNYAASGLLKNVLAFVTMVSLLMACPVLAKQSAREREAGPQSIAAKRFLSGEQPGQLTFHGSEMAELFSREINKSFQAVLKKNYQSESSPYCPGYITASVDGRPWHDTMWSRDGGTFLRELALWGYTRHACLLTDCLIRLVEKNKEGYFTFPEYFTGIKPGSGSELDGTAAIIIAMVLLWERLEEKDPYRTQIYHFLHQDASPVRYIHNRLAEQPLVAGSGEFGGGCGIEGEWYNVVQNNLLRLALLAAAKMESAAGKPDLAHIWQNDAQKLSDHMLKYLVDDDGSWLWCIDPHTLTADSAIIYNPINKGFGGLNGVACMLSDVMGVEPLASDWPGLTACEKTFAKLYAFPLRKQQFEKWGIWSQFDEFREGMSSGPSYGDGYALQTMLLLDKLDMAEKSVSYIAGATYQPPAEYTELQRDSPYYFYERYYSPDVVGKMKLEQGCGALNLVNVTEPVKAARLMMGLDDFSSEVKVVIRLPASWHGYKAKNWPIRTERGKSYADIEFQQKNGKSEFSLQVKKGPALPALAVRLMSRSGMVWQRQKEVVKIKLLCE